ncbi:MAG: DUF4124 domain-containing protein [Cellvibrionaceae bacterium]
MIRTIAKSGDPRGGRRALRHAPVAVLVTGIVGITLALPVPAEIYRWTDENGKVHFSDRPPRDRQAEDISDRARSVNVDSSGEERQKLNQLFAPESEEEKQLREDKDQALAAQREQRQRNCDKARRELKFFQEERFYRVDEQGNGSDVSEQERERIIADLSATIQRHCQ